MKSNDELNESKIWTIAIIAGAFVILFWILNWYYVTSRVTHDDRGIFGDMFGASTSIFTGFTIIGLIVTILLQRADLRIARESFNKQKEELELTRAEIAQQNDTLRIQRFENTFYNLLGIHQTAYKGLDEHGNLYKEIHERLLVIRNESDLGRLRNIYQTASKGSLDAKIYTYLHLFKKIVKIIYEENQDVINRSRYNELFFSQIDPYLRRFLFYDLVLRENSLPSHFEYYYKELLEDIKMNTDHINLADEALRIRIKDSLSS